MTKIGFIGVNLQIYNSKSGYFWEEGANFDAFWGRGRILTQSSIKNLKIRNCRLFFQRYTAFMAVFGQFFGKTHTALKPFLVNICSTAYYFNFLYTALMIFLAIFQK